MIEYCSGITEGNYAIYNGWSILNNAANFLCIYKRWELCREKGWLSGWGPECMCVVDIHTAVSKAIALCPEEYDKAFVLVYEWMLIVQKLSTVTFSSIHIYDTWRYHSYWYWLNLPPWFSRIP